MSIDKCSRCGESNTEFSKYIVDVDLGPVKSRVKFRGGSWVKRLVSKYVNRLLGTDLAVEVKVCQSCTSRMFRGLDKDV